MVRVTAAGVENLHGASVSGNSSQGKARTTLNGSHHLFSAVLWVPCSLMCVVPSLPNPQRGLTEVGTHCRTEELTDHINLSAPVKAAAYQCTIISCPQQMPQHQNWAIIWFSFCPKYPSGWFVSFVNIVLGPQLCNQCRWDETIVLQFALSLREYQRLSILLKSKKHFLLSPFPFVVLSLHWHDFIFF